MKSKDDLLPKETHHAEDSRISLSVEPETNGSLTRLRYLAASIPVARRLRRELWNSTEPLFPSSGDMASFAESLNQVWAWVQDSPEDTRVEKTMTYEVGANGVETLTREERKLKLPVLLTRWEEGNFVGKPLPFTHRAYTLSNAVHRLTQRMVKGVSLAWWREEGAAVYLTTGVFERSALPRWIVATAGLQAVGNKSRAYAQININDIASVSATEVANAYTRARQRLTQFEGEHEFKVSTGRPEEYASELLAQLELELILAKAYERNGRGESVRPENWDYRPKPKEIAEAWHRKAATFGFGTDKVPSRQSISNFQSRVARDLYVSAFSDLWNEEDGNRVFEEAERNHRRVVEAFKRKSKKSTSL